MRDRDDGRRGRHDSQEWPIHRVEGLLCHVTPHRDKSVQQVRPILSVVSPVTCVL